MNTYVIAHYGNAIPSFSYAKTLDEARAYAMTLLNSQQYRREDVLSIVNVANDAIVYFGKRDELIAKFNAVTHPATDVSTAWSPSFRTILNWFGMNVATPTIG